MSAETTAVTPRTTSTTASFRPVTSWVMADQLRSLALWALALCAVAAMYISFYPSIGGTEMDELIANLPEGVVTALGYDQIGSPAGYLSSTVYALLGPALLLVFAVQRGSSLIAGEEESGTLELELTAPIARRQVLAGRLLAMWISLAVLVVAVMVTSMAFVTVLDMDVKLGNIALTSVGLLLLTGGVGTVTAAAGAVTGRRAIAMGAGALVAVLGFVLDAIGPVTDNGWMTTISPFSWYIAEEPLVNGLDPVGTALLVALSVVAVVVGAIAYDRRDLMV